MLDNIKKDYYYWLIEKIFHDDLNYMTIYRDLLERLNYVTYIYTLELDENRQKDAQDLRYIFGYETDRSECEICQELDVYEPSLLEVIVALILRVQENILGDNEETITNKEIFLDIIKSLGLDDMTGAILSQEDVNYLHSKLFDFFCHNYNWNGEGSMFTVSNPKDDMRNTEIWYQCMWYINEKLQQKTGGKYL